MRIEINAGGLGAGLAVAEYQWNMSGYISDAENVISCFKTVAAEVCDLSGGVGNLQTALDEISVRIREEEDKKVSADAVRKQSDDFLDLAIRVDKQVASLVNQNKDEFYDTNPWLKPAVAVDGTPWYEDAWNWLCGTGELIAEGVQDVWQWTKNTALGIRTWVSDTAKKTWDGLVAIYNALLENYDHHGIVYYLWEGGKIAFKIGKAFVKIVGAVGVIFTPPYVGVPIAILSIISAGNDMINAFTDTACIITKQFDEVGKRDILKDTLVNNAGELGSLLGNKTAGEKVGELIYYGIDLVSFLDGADDLMKSFGKLNTDIYGSYTPHSFIWGKVSFDDVLDNEFDGLSKLKLEKLIKGTILGIDPSSTGALISDILDGIYKTYDDGSKLMENMLKILA